MKEGVKSKRLIKTSRIQELGILVILFLLSLFLSLTTETFLTSTNIFNILRAFSWIAISGFGILMVIITGGIDLSVGSVMAMAGLITAMMLKANFGVFLSILGGIFIGGLIGFINGILISKTNLPPFIATLGTMNIARGFCYGVTGGWPVRDLPKSFITLGQYDVPFLGVGIPLPVIFMIVLGIITSIFLNRTSWGYKIYAVGGNEQAARLSGINTGRIKVLVYTLCGALTAIGGILMTARLGVAAPTAALGYELDVIAAAVIGGASLTGGEGTVLGVIIGAAIMQVLRTGMVLLGFPAYWQPSAIGAIIILAIMFDQYRKRRMGLIR
ncbi:ABC transporter permease [Dictyoglomus thermophilum]|uniref:Ribose transport system permease protein RbsC n=1 Tax=Dictyoglomus thermophilum (strain ATCC 35947 / DSM 3960 / H-6-12) TaxID=309799 RepID=B5YAA3_DICT6|nr:ABC transporter permease [Dictyoglomus thermophilum]ACI19619.1 ribose transport system permease protein RbsC [Dictyoglomus thermophilum H-6-12]